MIAPTLLLRTAGTFEESEVLDAAAARKAIPSLWKAITSRLQLAEKGEWDILLTDYLKERVVHQERAQQVTYDEVIRDAIDTEVLHREERQRWSRTKTYRRPKRLYWGPPVHPLPKLRLLP